MDTSIIRLILVTLHMELSNMEEKAIMSSLFEEDYILRSLGSIVTQPDIALTELVANAWDAGASHVDIRIPNDINQILSIEDNGTGMTEDEFQTRWMKLRYNRLVNQSKRVVFPPNIKGKRTAFGRNGVGRHGLFCFGNSYKVSTRKGGNQHIFTIKPNIQSQPFAVTSKESSKSPLHGTKLEVVVTKNLPKAEKIIELLSARFLLDPQFTISVNGSTLSLTDLTGGQNPIEICVKSLSLILKLYFIDTTKSGKKSVFQGIAFWQGGRLVGEPSWNLGNRNIIDGRSSLAKRYTAVVITDGLDSYIKEDWSGFKKCAEIETVYDEVEKALDNCFKDVASATLETYAENLPTDVKTAVKDLNPIARQEFNETLSLIIQNNPKARQDSINIAAQAIINLEKSKSGKELLEKLAILSDEDIDGLNSILSKWSIHDASVVLNEIDRRLSVLAAIRKLSGDKNTDELHVLHPLITEARWLFGPEYESSEFIFNRQLGTVVNKIFGDKQIKNTATNYKKRPDLICLPTSSLSITGIEESVTDMSLVQMRRILLIELKRGGFKIKREEAYQAQCYVQDLFASNLGANCEVIAFVVGDSVDPNVSVKTDVCDNRGHIYTTNYDRLIDTAERRMFNLRQKLASRYEDIPGMELLKQIPLIN